LHKLLEGMSLSKPSRKNGLKKPYPSASSGIV
jgi:hypothetical protein